MAIGTRDSITRSIAILMLDVHVEESRLELSALTRVCQIGYPKGLHSWML